jgi:hypothetical protein
MVENNGLANKAAALFMWATEDGTTAAWQPTLSTITEAVTVVANPDFVNGGSGTDPVYEGLITTRNAHVPGSVDFLSVGHEFGGDC